VVILSIAPPSLDVRKTPRSSEGLGGGAEGRSGLGGEN
jgi:hypothetical protein